MELATVQALGSLLSVAVAVAAVVVALRSSRTADQAVQTARRQLALGAVPYLVIPAAPYGREERDYGRGDVMKLRVDVVNGGSIPALGIRATVWAADESFHVDPATRQASSRHPALVSGASVQLTMALPENLRTADPGGTWQHRFHVVELDYSGPHGSNFLQSYLWDVGGPNVWRIRRLTIDPADGGQPIEVEISL